MDQKEQKISDLGEFGFIRSIEAECLFSPEKVIQGIGDDCAVIGPYDGKVLLVTTDMLLQDIHFILPKTSPQVIGRKAAVVNLSDIAAMGGEPRHLFMSLAAPRAMDVGILHAMYRGVKGVCRDYGVNILGGDTSAFSEGIMISVTVIGEAREEEVLYRSGAGPGDRIYVTGTLGDSAAGLKLIKEQVTAPDKTAFPLRDAHNLPVPFMEAGRMIARSGLASAMIDLSDGLLSDLRHVCEASGVGARLFRSALPLSEEVRTLARLNKLDPYELALHGGEDYRLLVTVPEAHIEPFERMFKETGPCRVYGIGETTEKKGLGVIGPDGAEQGLEAAGFDHFK
ncbi:MAG: thiamine-phosphate kinase, partial [Deltaproteobacteria bacterium]|nr:thiamine-phosphate kinase [Deltaproteobacteria bacterium]